MYVLSAKVGEGMILEIDGNPVGVVKLIKSGNTSKLGFQCKPGVRFKRATPEAIDSQASSISNNQEISHEL